MSVPIEKLLCETRRVLEALAATADQALLSSGISAREHALLKVLAREPQPVAVASLVRATLTPTSEIRRVLSVLGARGWLEYHGDTLDWPGVTVVLNSQGHVHWARLLAGEQLMIERLSATLDEQDIHSTCVTLRRVRRLLQRTSAPVSVAPRRYDRDQPRAARADVHA